MSYELLHEMKGYRIFAKPNRFDYCICEPGIEPGSHDSHLRQGMLFAYAVFWELVDEGTMNGYLCRQGIVK
jgi:hypothetical protein